MVRFCGKWKPRPLLHRSMIHSSLPGLMPYKPHIAAKQSIDRHEKLVDFQKAQHDGKAFIPIKEQPPWRRYSPSEVDKGSKRNYAGIRVALVDQNDEPGFPTHFR